MNNSSIVSEAIPNLLQSQDVRFSSERFFRSILHDQEFVAAAKSELVDSREHLVRGSDDGYWEICYAFWSTLAIDRLDDWGFALEVGDFIERCAGTTRRALRMASRVAWETRGYPGLPRDLEEIENAGTARNLFLVSLYIERRRFMYQFEGVRELVDELHPSWLDQAFVEAALAYAEFGSREGNEAAAMTHLDSAWNGSRGTDMVGPVRDLCLQALDVADEHTQQAELLLEYSGRHERDSLRFGATGSSRSILQFRRARALRMLGRDKEALEAIDASLAQLYGDNDFTRLFAEQCLREREFVLFSRSLSETRRKIGEATDTVARQEARMEISIERATIRSTEVLALFSSAVAFAVGAAAIGANARTPTSAVASIVGLGLGLLGFVGLIVYVVSATTGVDANRVAHGHTRQQRFFMGAAFGLGLLGSLVGVLSLFEAVTR